MTKRDQELIDYFIQETNKRFDKIEAKVDTILEFKWQIIGGSLVLSGICSVAIAFLFGK